MNARYAVAALLAVAACGGRVVETEEGTHLRPSLVNVQREAPVSTAAGEPSSVGEPASEPASGELGSLPRTPVDLARLEAPAPSSSPPPPSSCACASVAIGCEGSARGYASADRAACTIALAPATCAAVASVPGMRRATEELAALVPGALASPEELWATCAVAHEARHACDGPALRVCETEQHAYTTSVACFEAFETQHCDGATKATACGFAALYRAASALARDFHACMCEASNGCARCVARCTAGQDADMRGFCGSLGDAYCEAGP